MRAMILGAGLGTRMRPLTDALPKPLLPVAGKPLIIHLLERLKKGGFSECVINLHYLGAKIKNFLGSGSLLGMTLLYSEEEKLLDTGGGIRKALPLLGEEPFLLVSGDIWTDFDFASLKHHTELCHLVMVPNPDFHPDGDFGLDKGCVTQNFPKYTYANIAVLHPELFSGVKETIFPVFSLITPQIAKRNVTGELFLGPWENVGTPTQLAQLNNRLSVHGHR